MPTNASVKCLSDAGFFLDEYVHLIYSIFHLFQQYLNFNITFYTFFFQKRCQFESHYEVLFQKSSYIAGNYQHIITYIQFSSCITETKLPNSKQTYLTTFCLHQGIEQNLNENCTSALSDPDLVCFLMIWHHCLRKILQDSDIVVFFFSRSASFRNMRWNIYQRRILSWTLPMTYSK